MSISSRAARFMVPAVCRSTLANIDFWIYGDYLETDLSGDGA
jgi:hypothetical protein